MKKSSNLLTLYIFLGMLVGIGTGYAVFLCYGSPAEGTAAAASSTPQTFADNVSILTDIFLRMIKMIIAPLVFSTLVVGVAKLGDIKAVGRIGGKTMLWFISATFVSLFLGLILVNVMKPGIALQLPLPDEHAATGIAKASMTLKGFFEHMVPDSVVNAMAHNEILQIVVFAVFFGIAAASIGEKAMPVVKLLDSVAHIMLKVTGFVMNFAPFAVFGAIAGVIAVKGPIVLVTYGKFIIQFYIALICLWLLITLAGYLILGKPVFRLLGRIKDPLLLAFGTATSEAAYPRTMEELEKFGCDSRIVSFVLPLGYSFNLDGSMMYMTFASLFIAQAYGMHLGIDQQITMLLVLMITSKGIAGVPRASLVVIAGTLSMFHIPEAGLLLLLGVDHLLDMGRSATNVIGNAMAAAVVSKWEKKLAPEEVPQSLT
jgi:Na+/H+-dicarboxylate symporter